ncbi:MAG: long-chain fatty acid--CoA ligase [Chitinophagales bacterium]|nr:long-chain fatty acid--CoA ligase [Chitinophagales bacterium]
MSYTRLFDILDHQLKNFPQEDCLASKVNGEWRKFSTQQVVNIVNEVSRAFLKLGIKPGDTIAIISNNRPEWNFVDLGMMQVGAISVPIYPTISEGEYKFIFNDAGIKLALVSDEGLYQKIQNIKKDVPSLRDIYTFDDVKGAKAWKDECKVVKDGDNSEVEKLKAGIKENDLVTIIYTSGTTGVPKGVMLSHKNVASNVAATIPSLPVSSEHKVLSFLPMCHIFERMVAYTYMAVGASIYYAESLETIGANLQEVKPQFFTSVPRLLEKVYDKIMSKGLELTGMKRKLFFWAVNLGLNFDDKGENSLWYNIQLAIARKLIFSKWKAALGGNVVGIVTGAAALRKDLARVFNAAGIAVREGYGQTETAPVLTANKLEEGGYWLGTVGLPIEGVTIKIDEKTQEILAKGPNIMMGYYKRQDLTDQTIDRDGWLHTGDQGTWLDHKGKKFLKITGRIKELFKTSGGKYVAPQVIENKMKESPFIEQMMVVGENQKFVSALIVPAFDYLKDWCGKNGVSYNTKEELVTNPKVLKAIQDEVEGFNKDFGKVEQVKKFKLLPADWTVDNGIMTPTMKVKRDVVMKQYQSEIDAIYANDTTPDNGNIV